MYKQIAINIDSLAVSRKTAAQITLSIIEFLLFNRNQIPFVFEKFQYMIKRLQEDTKAPDSDKISSALTYSIERHRNLAAETYKKIVEIQNVNTK